MSWGFFKKAKRGLKKAGQWLKNALNKSAEVMKKTKPILQQIENDFAAAQADAPEFKKSWDFHNSLCSFNSFNHILQLQFL